MTTKPPPQGAGRTPEKQALIEAYDSVVRAANTAAAPKAVRRSRRTQWSAAILLVALAGSAYLMSTRPAWLFTPPPPAEAAPVREASLRLAIYAAARRVQQYRDRTGRLPDRFEQTGEPAGGVIYRRTTSGYELQAGPPDLTLVYRSGDPLADFVGNSFAVVARRGQSR